MAGSSVLVRWQRGNVGATESHGEFTAERLSTIEPEKASEYTIRFWRGTGVVFGKGHRIRVEVSSSYFPYYLRNLNTGADNVALETKSVIARQTIFHDADRPSHIVLPVIPPRNKPTPCPSKP